MDELRTAQDYRNWAMSLRDFTPVAETAKGVCIIRGVDPYEFTGVGLPRWQIIAMEALLLAAIAHNEPKENTDAK